MNKKEIIFETQTEVNKTIA